MRQPQQNEKIYLLLMDVDNCFYHGYPKDYWWKYDEPSPVEWFVQSNQEFLECEVTRIITEGYASLILGYGTNRQCMWTDSANGYRGGSALPLLPLTQNYFVEKLAQREMIIPVFADIFRMADIYGINGASNAAGESYKANARKLYCGSMEEHAQWVFDREKISLIYTHVHRAATLNPGVEIVINFVDDTESILEIVKNFFSTKPDLFPDNVSLKLTRYNGKLRQDFCLPIKGTGKIDSHYDWTVRYWAVQCIFFSGSDLAPKTNMTAHELREYQSKNRYCARGRRMEMNGAQITIKDLVSFRTCETPSLLSTMSLNRQESYFIPGAFEGLIPAELIGTTPVVTPVVLERHAAALAQPALAINDNVGSYSARLFQPALASTDREGPEKVTTPCCGLNREV